jgi:CRP/FNR family transcriptional regulator
LTAIIDLVTEVGMPIQEGRVSAEVLSFKPDAVPVADLQSLFAHQPNEKFAAGAAIFWEGDKADHVFELVEGVLRSFKMLSDGRRVITGFIYPGDLIGVSCRDRYLYSAEAVVAAKVRRFGRNRFQETIAQSPQLRPQLMSWLCDEMAAAQDQMVLLARKSAEERVCSFLMLIAGRMRDPDSRAPSLHLPMTRLDMADYLGLTIETVSRTMSKLSQRGIIFQNGRNTVIIRDPARLAALAGETDGGFDGEAGLDYRAVSQHRH